MKNLKLIPIILLLTSILFSQSDSLKPKPLNSLKTGSLSLQFNVGYNFTISAFDGLAVSFKYHFKDKLALRFGMGLSSYTSERNYHRNFSVDTIETKNLFGNYSLASNVIIYFNPKSNVNFYVGLGPRFTLRFYRDEYLDQDDVINYNRSRGWSAGLNLVAGAEWFPVHYFGLFGEYIFNGEYSTGRNRYGIKYDNSYIELGTYSTETWEFNGSVAKLGLSAYF